VHTAIVENQCKQILVYIEYNADFLAMNGILRQTKARSTNDSPLPV